MTPSQIEMVKDSFQTLFTVKEALAGTFYKHLFMIAPGVRHTFPADMTEQNRKLSETISFVVFHLHDTAMLQEAASTLADRHIGAEARATHFIVGGVALIRALKIHSKRRMTEAETDAWLAAYTLITDMMIDHLAEQAA